MEREGGAGGRNANGHKTTAETKEGHTKRETWKQLRETRHGGSKTKHRHDWGKTHRGHGRLSQETQERDRAQKTDTNKLNSIKKLNSRLN